MRLGRAVATVGSFTLASRTLGFVRDIVLSAVLGSGSVADAFFVAFKLPNFFRRLFAEGAFSAAFVPLFARELQGAGRDHAVAFARHAQAALLVVLLPLVVLLMLAMPGVMALLAPGLRGEPPTFAMAVTFGRITFPYLLFISLTSLYGGVLNVAPGDPQAPGRDRFVLSKGHAGAGLYAALAERGFFPVEKLWTHYQDGSALCGHVSHELPGIDVSTGALGHGLSLAAGMAYAAKLRSGKQRIFCLLSDGECDEGSIWEAALFAAHHRLENLVAIVDYNRLQGIAPVGDVLELEPFADKWRAFGWEVSEADGHNHTALFTALNGIAFRAGKPSCLLAHTVKGKGVGFMENTVLWHYRTPRGAEFDAAWAELVAGGSDLPQEGLA